MSDAPTQVLAQALEQAWQGNWKSLDNFIDQYGNSYLDRTDQALRQAYLKECDYLAMAVFLVRTRRSCAADGEFTTEEIFQAFYLGFKSHELRVLWEKGDEEAGQRLLDCIGMISGVMEVCIDRENEKQFERGEENYDLFASLEQFSAIVFDSLLKISRGLGKTLHPKKYLCLSWIGELNRESDFPRYANDFSQYIYQNFIKFWRRAVASKKAREWGLRDFLYDLDEHDRKDLCGRMILTLVQNPRKHICKITYMPENADLFEGYLINHLIFNFRVFRNSRQRHAKQRDETLLMSEATVSNTDGGDYSFLDEPEAELEDFDLLRIITLLQETNQNRLQFAAFCLNTIAALEQQHISLLLGVKRGTLGGWISARKNRFKEILEQSDTMDALPVESNQSLRQNSDEATLAKLEEKIIKPTLRRLKEHFSLVEALQNALPRGEQVAELAQMFSDGKNEKIILEAINHELDAVGCGLRFALENVRFLQRLHELEPAVREVMIYRALLNWPTREIIGGYVRGLDVPGFEALWQAGVMGLLGEEFADG